MFFSFHSLFKIDSHTLSENTENRVGNNLQFQLICYTSLVVYFRRGLGKL